MNRDLMFVLIFGIGVIAGLRSFTAPAVASWMIHLRGADMHGSHLTFMGSLPAAIIFSLLAIAELVTDKLPKTPSRTTAGPFAARIVMGALAGGALFVAASVGHGGIGAILGAIGAVAGTYGGYFARTGTVKALHAPDFVIALIEDAVAVGGGILLASQLVR
jgi:uncharacterized membrane protein